MPEKRPIGRPTLYRPSYVKKAFELCLLGCTDERIAEHLNISIRRLHAWKHDHPAFGDAFIRGREGADAAVAGALYKKAIGFERKSEKIHVTKDGQVIKVPFVEYYPPDPTAILFYLPNRQRVYWSHKHEAFLNLNFSLETLVTESIKLREEREQKAKTLEHKPAPPDAPPTEQP